MIYQYEVKETRVVDGDTIDVMVDLGLKIYTWQRLRLLGIDAWEPRGPNREKGKAASIALELLIANNLPISVETHKDRKGKYGRYLANIRGRDGLDINAEMVKLGHAEIPE